MNKNKIDYILDDVVFIGLNVLDRENLNYVIFDDKINFLNDTNLVYFEDLNTFNIMSLNQEDFKFLDYIFLNYEKMNSLNFESNSILKYIFFFSNEQYLIKQIKDKHNRICIGSVNPVLKKYLEIPITDILINIFLKKCNLLVNYRFKFNLTCDYDILNFWSGISSKSKIKLFLELLYRLEFKLFTKQMLSFCFSRFINNLNYYLNSDMFLFNYNSSKYEVENIAFLLIDYSNLEYDFKNKFSRNIHKFINDIKHNKVILGLHPSYNSSGSQKLIFHQLKLFNNLFDLKSNIVRFHYLKIDYSKDLEILEKKQVKYDYSFGFPDSLLFRGGITKRFKMWNTIAAKSFDVTIVPLTIMDGTLFDYLGYERDSDFKEISNKLELSFDYGFEITTLIHNNGMTKMATKKDISFNLNNLILNFVKSKLKSEDAI